MLWDMHEAVNITCKYGAVSSEGGNEVERKQKHIYDLPLNFTLETNY